MANMLPPPALCEQAPRYAGEARTIDLQAIEDILKPGEGYVLCRQAFYKTLSGSVIVVNMEAQAKHMGTAHGE